MIYQLLKNYKMGVNVLPSNNVDILPIDHTISPRRYKQTPLQKVFLDLQKSKEKKGVCEHEQLSISSTFLRTNFSYKRRFSSFYYVHATRKSCQNNVRTKNLYVKRWWNWHQTFIVSNYSKSRISHYKVCLMKNDFFWKIKWTFPWR